MDKLNKITDVQIIIDNMYGGFLVQVTRGALHRKSYQNPNPLWASRLMELVYKPVTDLINICKNSGYTLRYHPELSELGCGYDIIRDGETIAMGCGGNRIQAAKMILQKWETDGKPKNAKCYHGCGNEAEGWFYGNLICMKCSIESYWR